MIVAYFSISFHVWSVSENQNVLSKSKRKDIDGLSHSNRDGLLKCHFPVYLIGQLGRSDSYGSDTLSGNEILDMALSIISIAQEKIGGRYSLIECADVPHLKAYYSRYGYSEIEKDEEDHLLSFIKKLE